MGSGSKSNHEVILGDPHIHLLPTLKRKIMVRRKNRIRERATSTKASKLEIRRDHWEKLRGKASSGDSFEAANQRPGRSDCRK